MHETSDRLQRRRLFEDGIITLADSNEDIDYYPQRRGSYSWAWNSAYLPKRIDLGENASNIFFLITASASIEGGQKSFQETNNPFIQEDLQATNENRAQELVLRIRRSLNLEHREALANRLIALLNDAKQEDPTSIGLDVGSLQSFYNFLQLSPGLKYPAISLTPECNIYISWRADNKHVFSVHFISDDNASFVVFRPNKMHPDRQLRLSGNTTTDLLLETVAQYEVLDWISE